MALKQEHALLIGLAVAGAVVGIYQISMPSVASVRASRAGNKHIDSARKGATITSASLVAVVGLLAQSPDVFVIGGIAVIAMDFTHRVANATDHQSGKIPSTAQAAGTSQPASSAPGS